MKDTVTIGIEEYNNLRDLKMKVHGTKDEITIIYGRYGYRRYLTDNETIKELAKEVEDLKLSNKDLLKGLDELKKPSLILKYSHSIEDVYKMSLWQLIIWKLNR